MDFKKTCFIVDSSSGLKNNEIKDVYVISLLVVETKSDKTEISHLDNVDISSEKVITMLKNNVDLKTSQSPIGAMMDLVEELFQKYDTIFVVPISSGISGSYESWLMVLNEFPNKNLFILNALEVSCGIRDSVLDVKKMVEQKKDVEEIKHFLAERAKRRYGVLIVTDITQLKKGGRISSFKAALVKALKLNLLIGFDGKLEFYGKEMSREKAIDNAIATIDKKINFKKNGIKRAYMYTTYEEKETNDKLKSELESKINHQVECSIFPPTISIHTGHNAFALFIEAEK